MKICSGCGSALAEQLARIEKQQAAIIAALREVICPTELTAERQLEIAELARQMKAGNKQALKDWNKREEGKQRLRKELHG